MSLEAKNSLLSLSPAQPSPTQPSPATLALAAPGTTAQLPWPGLGAGSYARQPSWDLRDSLTDANFTVAVAGLKDPEDSTLAAENKEILKNGQKYLPLLYLHFSGVNGNNTTYP